MDADTGRDEVAEARRLIVLDSLGLSLAAKRREAVAHKSASGIETEWQGDEEFYQGYDDANRSEFVNTASKPIVSGSAPTDDAKPAGSTVFPNITQPYVDAAAARVGDMLLPTDDRNFAIEETPIPDMFEGLDDALGAQPGANDKPGLPPLQGMPLTAAPAPMVQMPDGAVMAIVEAKARFDKMKAEAARKAGKAQDRIDDWLVECQYHPELRKVIDDSAKLGSGVIKGPVPIKRSARQWRKNEQDVYQLVMIEEIKPGSFRVDPWNLFPDPACGESIHNGAYIFERDFLTGKKLEDFIGVPGYIESQIRTCLTEGPARAHEADARMVMNTTSRSKDQFEIWYFHGTIKAEELVAAGCDCDDMSKSYPAMLTMVNDRVIRASLNPLDSGDFPYDVIPWKRRPGMPWGMSVARQMRTPQRIVVAGARNLMDNAGFAAGPQLVIRRGVEPEDNVWEIVPLKLWREGDDSAGDATGSPITSVVIPMLQAELMAIIQFGMKMAEDVTGLPALMQGQQGSAPETVGGMQILNNNANSVLRRIARLFDSCITEPHIRRYYNWLMEYGEDDDEKGDFQIVARGSSALVERDIQSQELVNVVQLCLNPAFKKNPAKAMDEYLKSRRFDPKAFDYTEEELAQIAQQQPPEDPRITAAKIMAEARQKDIQLSQQGDQAKAQMQQQFDMQEAERDREFQRTMAELTAQLDQQELQGKQNISLEDIKAMLAATVMKLKVQKELSDSSRLTDLQKHNTPQASTPPTEPAGRAPAGMAYQA